MRNLFLFSFFVALDLYALCAVDGLATQVLPVGGIGKSVLIVRLANGQLLKSETPYLTGVGHDAMVQYIEDNHGGISKILFAGETVTTPDGTVYVKDTSRLNSPDYKTERNVNDLKNYAKYSGDKKVIERPRKPGEYNLYPELNGLDSRLNTKPTDNIKHDIIIQELIGLQLHIEGAAEIPAQRDNSRQVARRVMGNPVFAAIFELVERDGVDTRRLKAMKQKLESKAKLTDRDWKEFRNTLHFYFHFRGNPSDKIPEETLERLIQVQTLSDPD